MNITHASGDSQNGEEADDEDHGGARPKMSGQPSLGPGLGESVSDDSDVDKLETWRAAGQALRETLDKLQRNSDKHLVTEKHVKSKKKSEPKQLIDSERKERKESNVNPDSENVHGSNSTPRRRHCRARKGSNVECVPEPSRFVASSEVAMEQADSHEPTLAELTHNLHQRLQQINATLPLSSPLLSNKKAKHSPRTSRLSSSKAEEDSHSSSSGAATPCTCLNKKSKSIRKHHRHSSQGKASDLVQSFSPTSPRRSSAVENCERCSAAKNFNAENLQTQTSKTIPVSRVDVSQEKINQCSRIKPVSVVGQPNVAVISDSDSEAQIVPSSPCDTAVSAQMSTTTRGGQASQSQSRLRSGRGLPGRLVETDSAANLADIESLCEDETEDTESYHSQIQQGFTIGGTLLSKNSNVQNKNAQSTKGISSPVDTQNVITQVCSSTTRSPSSTDENEVVAAGMCLEKYKKNIANSKLKKMISTDQEDENPGFGVGDDSFDDMPDLQLEVDSESPNESAIKLSQNELDSFSDLHISAQESDDEDADDEFECDCLSCQWERSAQRDVDLLTSSQTFLDPDNNSQFPQGVDDGYGRPFNFELSDLYPQETFAHVSSILNGSGQDILSMMFHNVIMAMLNVYPDLLSDQAPPPLSFNAIAHLPTQKIQSTPGEEVTCAVCLCNFEDGEEVKLLPCSHKFHPLCVQAWLNKSGTCPVCRHVIPNQSPSNEAI